jgi:hypothetical protein
MEDSMKVFSYVIQYDAGSAPNYDSPATTLAICKPRIRRSAQARDLVIAFQGSALGPEPHGVRWAGVVSEKLFFDEYWNDRRYQVKKPDRTRLSDNIYRPVGADFVQVENEVHDLENATTDLGGKFVLVFEQSWRFGPTAPILPEEFGLRMVGSRRNHRVKEIEDSEWIQLRAWLDRNKTATELLDANGRACRAPPKPKAVEAACTKRTTHITKSKC